MNVLVSRICYLCRRVTIKTKRKTGQAILHRTSQKKQRFAVIIIMYLLLSLYIILHIIIIIIIVYLINTSHFVPYDYNNITYSIAFVWLNYRS